MSAKIRKRQISYQKQQKHVQETERRRRKKNKKNHQLISNERSIARENTSIYTPYVYLGNYTFISSIIYLFRSYKSILTYLKKYQQQQQLKMRMRMFLSIHTIILAVIHGSHKQ